MRRLALLSASIRAVCLSLPLQGRIMKSSRKRVVITGMGILSSLAENLQDFKSALLNKRCGVTDSQRFAKWFENARAAEGLQDIQFHELAD